MKTFSKIAIVLILWAVIPFAAATLATAMFNATRISQKAPAVKLAAVEDDHGIKDGDDALFNYR